MDIRGGGVERVKGVDNLSCERYTEGELFTSPYSLVVFCFFVFFDF